MQTVRVKASKEYDIHIGSGLLADNKQLKEMVSGRSVMVVSDDIVAGLYENKVKKLLNESAKRTESFVFPHGENSKNLTVFQELVEKMCESRMTRSDMVIALGGGVSGDMAGFAAATYQRGIEFVQIPTTLLAAVDSSVGGKTGVDLVAGKNQIGAFHQPSLVLCDTDTLRTLPGEEYRNGCAEIIKYAVLGNRELFDKLKEKPVSEQYEDVIEKCVSMKRDIVEKDEFDLGLRMLLNFGHTIGHAVETCSKYSVPHGMGVAIGMDIITKASEELGYCEKDTYEELHKLIVAYGLPTETTFTAAELAEAITADKKSKGDKVTLIVPKKIGECIPVTIPKAEILSWLHKGGVR